MSSGKSHAGSSSSANAAADSAEDSEDEDLVAQYWAQEARRLEAGVLWACFPRSCVSICVITSV